MAIAYPSTPSFSTSFCCTRAELTRLTRLPSVYLAQVRRNQTHSLTRRLVVSSRLNSSKSSDAGGSVSPDNGDTPSEFQHDFSPQRLRSGSPIFVTLPVNAVGPEEQLRKLNAIRFSLRALAAAEVEGIVIEICWVWLRGTNLGFIIGEGIRNSSSWPPLVA